MTLGTITETVLELVKSELRVTVATVPLAVQVPVAPVIEQAVPYRVRVFGNWTTIILPPVRSLAVVKVIVQVPATLTELLLMDTEALVRAPGLTITTLVAVSIKYTLPLELVTVVMTMLAGLTEVGLVALKLLMVVMVPPIITLVVWTPVNEIIVELLK